MTSTSTTHSADAPDAAAIHRHHLPKTRRSITHKFAINSHEGYLTIGIHEDGSPGEIFIKMSKEGSTLSGLIQAFCRAFSLALQYGLSLEDAIVRFKDMRFEPMGMTTNPEIPHAKSIVDYAARYLESQFLRKADEPDRPGASSGTAGGASARDSFESN